MRPLPARLRADARSKQPVAGFDPTEAVVRGAATIAAILSGEGDGPMCIMPLIPLSIGIETAGGVYTPIVSRNSIYVR